MITVAFIMGGFWLMRFLFVPDPPLPRRVATRHQIPASDL